MARLISKVVRSKSGDQRDGHYSSSWNKSNPTNHAPNNASSGTRRNSTLMSKLGKSKPTADREGSSGSDIHLATYNEQHAITKTIETTVVEDEFGNGHLGRQSSDRNRVYDRTDRTFQQSV